MTFHNLSFLYDGKIVADKFYKCKDVINIF